MNVTWDDVRIWLRRALGRGKVGVETLAESFDRQASIHGLVTQVRSLKRQRDEALLGIGKKVYTLYVRGKVRNRDVLGDCEKIDALRAEILKLQAEINEIRAGANAEPGDEKLSDDSAPLEDEDEATPEAPAAPAEPAAAAPVSPVVDEDVEDEEAG